MEVGAGGGGEVANVRIRPIAHIHLMTGSSIRTTIPPMELRVFKPLDWKTAVVEFWGDRLIGEVFARHDGVRRLYLSREAAAWGVDWQEFNGLVPRVTPLLDEADEEMRHGRESLAEH